MNTVLQGLIVAVVVTLCTFYSVWRLLPARLRLRALEAGAHLPLIGRSAWLSALRAQARSRLGGGCGACAPAATSAASPKQTPGALRRS
jgi:hypothetical protein